MHLWKQELLESKSLSQIVKLSLRKGLKPTQVIFGTIGLTSQRNASGRYLVACFFFCPSETTKARKELCFLS